MSEQPIKDYGFRSVDQTWDNDFLLQPIIKMLSSRSNIKRIFEIGCGNGATARDLSSIGYDVTGIDPSVSGISVANEAFPELSLAVGSAYDDLSATYGQFPCVLSLEVIEHCYYPRKYMQTISELLEDGGVGIISTPYHGYWKNLAMALMGKMDFHFTALWDGGHIKFFSIRTMSQLLEEFGFKNIRFVRVGRIPILAKSMVVTFEK